MSTLDLPIVPGSLADGKEKKKTSRISVVVRKLLPPGTLLAGSLPLNPSAPPRCPMQLLTICCNPSSMPVIA